MSLHGVVVLGSQFYCHPLLGPRALLGHDLLGGAKPERFTRKTKENMKLFSVSHLGICKPGV